MSERRKYEEENVFLFEISTKLHIIVQTMEQEIKAISQHYQKQIDHLQSIIHDKDKQINQLKQKLSPPKVDQITPIKILLKHPKPGDKRNDSQSLTDRQNNKLKTEQQQCLNTHITPQSITKTRPSFQICVNLKQFAASSDKKEDRYSTSKLKNKIISRPRQSMNFDKKDQLAQFSVNILQQAKKQKNYKPQSFQMNSPRIRRQKLSELSIMNRNSFDGITEDRSFHKTKHSMKAMKSTIEKENHNATITLGQKKIHRKSNSKRNLLAKKKIHQNSEETHSKKCIDLTIPVKIINVVEIDKN